MFIGNLNNISYIENYFIYHRQCYSFLKLSDMVEYTDVQICKEIDQKAHICCCINQDLRSIKLLHNLNCPLVPNVTKFFTFHQ